MNAQQGLFRVVVEFKFALIGMVDGFANRPCEVDVGGAHPQPGLRFVDRHHPLQRVLGSLTLGLVADQMSDLLAVSQQEISLKENKPCRVMILHTPAGWAAGPMRVGWGHDAPLPTPTAKDGPAMRTDGRVGKLPPGLVAIVLCFLQQAITASRMKTGRN